MRTLEILILVILFIRLVGGSIPPIKRSRWMDYLPVLAVLLTVAHGILEKYRLQMAPAYALVLFFFLLSLYRIIRRQRLPEKRPSRRIWIFTGVFLRLLIFIPVAALPILLPVFRLPAPTGPFPVGTTRLYLVDETRPEIYTPDPADHRQFMAQVWYPAQVEPGARPAPLMTHMPVQFRYLSLVKTHAVLNAPVSNAQSSYPVLIFSHGLAGFIEQNLTQIEELASHGYIVCSLAHPYHTLVTVFPDGHVVLADSTLANDLLKGKSPAREKYVEYLATWTADTQFLIDELERIQAGEVENLLAGKLDTARLGIFGQSFGGTTAVQVCSVDDRCQAGINLDGSLPQDYTGRMLDSHLEQPFMFLLNEGRASTTVTDLNTTENTAYGLVIRGTTHYDFTDLFLYSPAFKLTRAFGPIDGYRMDKILNAYTLAFFDETLKGEKTPLLDGPSPDYPEVTIQIRNP